MTGFTIAAQPDAASHYSSATTGFAFTAHKRLRRIYRSCSRCRRLRSRRKTFHPRVSGTAQKPVLRLLRNRTQPRITRQRLQVLRSQRTIACAGFIALVAAAEGCVRRRSRRKTLHRHCAEAGFTIAAQPDAASHYSSATTGFAFTAHERLRMIYRSCSRCRRLRSAA